MNKNRKNNTRVAAEADALLQLATNMKAAINELKKACDEAPDGTPLDSVLDDLIDKQRKQHTPMELLKIELNAHKLSLLSLIRADEDIIETVNFTFDNMYKEFKDILMGAIADAQDKAYNRGYNNGIRHASKK